MRVYLTNVESICKRFLDERRDRLGRLSTGEGSAFAKYWTGLAPPQQQALVTEKADTLLKVLLSERCQWVVGAWQMACVMFVVSLHHLVPLQGLVKQFFNEKEVTSTLVMDALLCGCKQLEAASRGVQPPENGAGSPLVTVDAERSTFAVNGCLVDALQRAVSDVLPPSG